MKFQGQLERLHKKDRIERPIFPSLEVGSEKFFDNHMLNYIGKLKMIKWNRFNTECRNE